MTFPSADVSRVNLDNTGDSPQLARAQLLDLVDKFNQLRNHFSVFMQGLIDDTDAATARATLGALASSAASAYGLTLLDDADAATARATLGLVIGSNVPSPTGSGASGTWGIDILGQAGVALGVGQTWQSVSLISGVTNYNMMGRPIVTCAFTTSPSSSNSVSLSVGGVTVLTNQFSVGGAVGQTAASAVIPAGAAYVWTAVGATSYRELR